MKFQIDDKLIPGTILDRIEMGNVTGLEFLKKIFYISDGIMLSQIKEISGIGGTTLQNWTKRGWVENSTQKKYNIDQLAHILIINMLRESMNLDKIAFIISYVNGRVWDRSDDIINDSRLYDYICRILDRLVDDGIDADDGTTLRSCINEIVYDYVETISGAKERLCNALEIIVIAYYASIIKKRSDEMVDSLMKG